MPIPETGMFSHGAEHMIQVAHTPPVESRLREASAELERRLRAGAGGAEAVLAAYPELTLRTETALEVIYTEFLIRQELGAAPGLAELQQRFPQWHRDLAELFEVHAAVGLPGAATDAGAGPRGGDGPLELLEEIRRGGMGVVYKARQKDLNRLVAVKMMLAGAFAGPEELQRFRREAEAVARLRHANIVSIYGFGEWPDARAATPGGEPIPYLMLEYVEAGTLEDKLAGGPWPAAEAARMVETLARATHYAHLQGILHRDLKPANVLLTADGTPKITDFGLAKCMTPADSADRDTAPGGRGPTVTGAVLGTPSYLAPEQAGGQEGPPGPAADIYALGAILYELLTGRPPHQAANPLETLVQVRSREPIPPRRLQPGLARDLETVCLKCLHKSPERRYASAEALADDLQRFQAGKPVQARPVGPCEASWRWCRRNPLAAGLLALLMLALAGGVGGVVWQWRRAEARAREATRERELAEAHFNRTWAAVERMTRSAERIVRQQRMGVVARDLVNDTLAFYEDFLNQADHAPRDRLKMAQACLHVGHIRAWGDEGRQAIEAYRLACTLFGGLHEESPDDNAVLYNLGSSYRALGAIHRRGGNHADATAALAQAIHFQERLAAREPAKPSHKARLANYLANYCAALSWPDRRRRAEPYLRRAIDLAKQAHEAQPGNAGFRQELALNLDDLGLLLWGSRRAPEAESLCREAWTIRRELVGAPGTDHGARHFLARSHVHLGIIAADRGRQAEAEGEFGHAVGIMEGLVKDYQRVEYRKDLVNFSVRLAALLTQAERHAAAATVFARTWQCCRDDPTALNLYAWTLATCPDVALRDPPRAVTLAGKAVAAAPANGEFLNTLGVAHYRNGNLKEARAALDKAAQLRSGGDASDWFFLAMICQRSGDEAQARKWFDRAARWTAQHIPHSAEVRRFQEEAESVLGRRRRGE